MFNLLVSSDETDWEGTSTTFPVSRCLREYTDDAITKRYGGFDVTAIGALVTMPAVFAYEKAVGKDPMFGNLTQIRKRTNSLEVRIDYQLAALPKFLTNDELWGMESELDLGGWESSRTHWAVKDVDLAQELASKGIILPPRFLTTARAGPPPSPVDITKHVFDAGFSFPGEYRDVVEAVAKETTALLGAHSCFYDNNYQAQLARPSLDLFLQDIYGRRCKLLVAFIGTDYQRKVWPGIEWNAIRSVMSAAKEKGRIMYVRLDDGAVDGVFQQDGFIDARRFTPAQIAAFIAERVAFIPPM
jgi:hypothetical protein